MGGEPLSLFSDLGDPLLEQNTFPTLTVIFAFYFLLPLSTSLHLTYFFSHFLLVSLSAPFLSTMNPPFVLPLLSYIF